MTGKGNSLNEKPTAAPMPGGLSNRHIMIGAGVLTGAILAVAAALGIVLASNQYQAADYPGSVLVADHTLSKVWPALVFRRDTSYRSSDPLPAIYNWYSQRFRLGTERRAQSACITLERSNTWWLAQEYIGVTICDTATGRMMFVQRTFTLRSLMGPARAAP